jgi:hypothetical protein
MDRNEIRYRIISTLLQAGGPLTLPELMAGAEVAEAELFPILSLFFAPFESNRKRSRARNTSLTLPAMRVGWGSGWRKGQSRPFCPSSGLRSCC